jgi:cellulose synthase/poly-beta-1,6-N-acetylglucosamine synthase-like glycosyltransferase
MIFLATSLVLLTMILLWTVYHIPIMLAGVRAHRKKADCIPAKGGMLPKFSLIVPAKNEARVIGRCLKALLNLDYPPERMEIIIVDGGSEDGTMGVCLGFARRFPQIVRVLSEAASTGKPGALNLALPHVTGDIVGVFDADSVPERNVLHKVASNFENPSLAAVQGRTISLNQEKNILAKVAAMEERAWLQSMVNGRERLNLFVPLTGSCQFIRRKILEEMDGWAENSLAEDVELSLRLVEEGLPVKYAPEVCSRQETPSSLRSLIKQRTRWYRGYMETALQYGRLLKNPRWKTIDAEISLTGPFVMVLCLISYLNWALSLIIPTGTFGPLPNLGTMAMLLTSVSLFSIGAALALTEEPAKLRNLGWIPFIYAYWFLQTIIAGHAFLRIVLGRRKVWQKTAKDGF